MSFSPKPALLVLILLFYCFNLIAQNAWINEFHYDNDGGDVGEFIEVVLQDADSYDLNLFTVHLYNGSNGESYGAHSLDSFDEGISENGFTVFYKNIPGIQNGAPDGFSLDYDNTLIQFISYEGSFTGAGGVAAGMPSEDIGVEVPASTPIETSLQLSGNGIITSDFSWLEPNEKTPGHLNNEQNLGPTCIPPAHQAVFSIPTLGDISDDKITLNWTRGNGDAVVVVVKENSPVNENPINGTPYTAGNDLSSGLAEEIGVGNFVVYEGSGNSLDITGLTQGTEYHFSIFEYYAADFCYLTEVESLTVFTTNSFDKDSKIEAPETQVRKTYIPSILNSEVDAVEVFKFKITDLGTDDGVSTLLKNVVIEKSIENTVSDWSRVIKGAKLNDGNSDLNINQLSINQDQIEFDFTGNEIEILDGESKEFSLLIWLEETQMDSDTLAFEISENHKFQVNPSGSSFQYPLSSPVSSQAFNIEVQATELVVQNIPQEVYVRDTFELRIEAVDINGNIDLSSRNLRISSNGSGSLSGATDRSLINGEALFDDLAYNFAEENSFTISTDELSVEVIISFIEPIISIDKSSFISEFESIKFPNSSKYQSYHVFTENIRDSVCIIAPEGFQLSLNSNFENETNTLFLKRESFDETEVFVRFSPMDANGKLYQGNIIHFSQDSDTVNLAVSGQEGTLILSSIRSVKEKQVGERVKIQGVVIGGSNHFENKRIIQDETAGIVLESEKLANVNFGDSLEVEGVLTESDGWLVVNVESEVEIFASDSIFLEPNSLTIPEIDENMEFQRIEIENIEISGEGHFERGEYFVFDDADTVILKIKSNNHSLIGTEIPFEKVNLSGFISKSQHFFNIYPEFLQDVEIIPRETLLTINAPKDGLNFGNVFLDDSSEPRSYKIAAENLPEDLNISVSENFEMSLLENSNYTSELVLPINRKGNIPEIDIYVRFSPRQAKGGIVNGEIRHSSGDQKMSIALKGIEELITSNNRSLKEKIVIYPNPTSAYLRIKLNSPNESHYQLLGLDGVIFLEGEIYRCHTLDLVGLDKNVYFLKIRIDGDEYVQRIIIQN
ncbi:Por secretion system C-terminal sorting domain-containing protein [Marivirga sericea]|uniref:Por secretion system C-terminal sorting domain-containing protein n=1 Tax=Marivirga sericea TaxID=1028 RepID=A0A1X7KBJ4_9BACT|nr:T9SS type A sorting domain-containing protein [Marivirga sericea]SMG38226.1 Por secretion system C-terminal sorting domain-containing protein [Marivirga sericea]